MQNGQVQPWRLETLQEAGRFRTAGHIEPVVDLVQIEDDSLTTPEEALERLWHRQEVTLEDLSDDTLRIAWRLVRHVLRFRGWLADDEYLHEGTSMSPDPWTNPVAYKSGHKVQRIRDWEKIAPTPLLPPDVPAELCDGNKAVIGYNPATDDPNLHQWLRLMERCATHLSIGSRKADQYGLKPLLDPFTVRASFPAPESLYLIEQLMVEEALTVYLEKGVQGLLKDMARSHGLTKMESLSLFRLATRSAEGRVTDKQNQNYALMVLRLETLSHKARMTADVRAELACLKLLSIIQGLASIDADDDKSDVSATVRELASARTKLLENGRSRPHVTVNGKH